MLVKPCKQAEIGFYQDAAAHPELQYYMPLFMGLLQLNQEATEAAAHALGSPVSRNTGMLERPRSSGSGVVPVTESWVPSGGAAISTDSGIVLENVAHGFRKPNIMDVKIGARLWDDDADPKKREKLDKVASETTSGPLGFRVAGMKTYVGRNSEPLHHDTNGYKKYDKSYGRRFSVDDVHTAFEEFFYEEEAGITRRLGKRIIKRFLLDLRGLVEVLEKEETRMYSASLLFVYEGDGDELARRFDKEAAMLKARAQDPSDRAAQPSSATLQPPELEEGTDGAGGGADGDSDSDLENNFPKLQAIKMIDFAHAHFVKGQGRDENVLHGVRNVIDVLETIIQ
jgi:1D-myo-inositol-tetrakisphosphate 5-kinase/inositol-polyphosphate multikinase